MRRILGIWKQSQMIPFMDVMCWSSPSEAHLAVEGWYFALLGSHTHTKNTEACIIELTSKTDALALML